MPKLDREGKFSAKVLPSTSWFGEAGKDKTPFVGLPLEIVDGECAGQHISAFLYLTENAFDRTIKTLHEVFGFNGDLEALALGMFTFAGRDCQITTEYEDYNGGRRLKVKWLNPVSNFRPMEGAIEFAKRMQSRAQRVLNPAAATPAVEKATSENTKDELPF